MSVLNAVKSQILTQTLAPLVEPMGPVAGPLVLDKIMNKYENQSSGGGGYGPVPNAIPQGELQELVKKMAERRYGWTGDDWDSLYQLIAHESGWNPNAANDTSTAAGLFQFLDATRENYGIGLNSPLKQQIKAGLDYVKDRYGDPEYAWAFWQDPQKYNPNWPGEHGY